MTKKPDSPIDLIGLMDAGYDAKDAQEWPIYGTEQMLDRREYVTASEIGKCAREIAFNKLAMTIGGYDPEVGTKNHSRDQWGFFERGHTMEAWAAKMIHDGIVAQGFDVALICTGENQRSFIAGEQSGTPDGVFLFGVPGNLTSTMRILEIKSIDPRTNIRNLPKKDHVTQVMQNLDLVAETLNVVPAGGDLIYINASDYKKRYPFSIDWDESEAGRLQARAEWIMAADSPADLPAEGLHVRGCTYCNHTAQCSALVMKEQNERGKTNVNESTQASSYATASKKLFG